MARVKFDLGDCIGYSYKGETYTAKELFDKLRVGELKKLIAQGVVTLSREQAPTVVDEYVKKEQVKVVARRPNVKSSNEEIMSYYLLSQPVYYRVRNGNSITQSAGLVEDYIYENGKTVEAFQEGKGKIAFLKIQNVDTPIPINDVSKEKLRQLKEKNSKAIAFPSESKKLKSYNNGIEITNTINKSDADIITFAKGEKGNESSWIKLDEQGWDKNSVSRFQKSLKRAFQNSNLGEKVFQGKIQLVLMDNKSVLDWLTFNNPAQADFIVSNKLSLKGVYVSNQPGLVVLNVDKASPTTALHEAIGHMWEQWAGGNPVVLHGGNEFISEKRQEAEALSTFMFTKKVDIANKGGNAPALHAAAMGKTKETNLYKFIEKGAKILQNKSYNGEALFNIIVAQNEELYKSLNLDDSEIKEYLQYLYQSGYSLQTEAAYKFALNTVSREIFAKAIETNANSLAKSDKSVVEFFRDLINKLYEAVIKIAGFKTLTVSDLAKMDINQFSQTVIAEVLNEDLSTDVKRKGIELAPGQVSLKEELSERIGIGVKGNGEFVDEDNIDDSYSLPDDRSEEEIEAAGEQVIQGSIEAAQRLIDEKAARDYEGITPEDVMKEESNKRRRITAYMLIRNSPAEVIQPLIDVLQDSDSYKQTLDQNPGLSIENYIDGVMVGRFPLTQSDRKKLGTAQKGLLYQFYKYHAEHIADKNLTKLTQRVESNKEKIAALEAQLPKKKKGKVSEEDAKLTAKVNKEIDKFKSYIEKDTKAIESAKEESISAEELFDKVKREWVELNKSFELDRTQQTVEEVFEQKVDKKGVPIFEKINKAYEKLAKAKTPEQKAKIRQEIDGYTASYMDLFNPSTMMSIGGLFHVSPSDFKEFNHKYIGTGEGMQAFGWGTYLTNAESVRDYYLSSLRREGVEIKGQKYGGTSPLVKLLNDTLFDSLEKRYFDYFSKFGAKLKLDTASGKMKLSFGKLTNKEIDSAKQDLKAIYDREQEEVNAFGGRFNALKSALQNGYIKSSQYTDKINDELNDLIYEYQYKNNVEDSYFLLSKINKLNTQLSEIDETIDKIASGEIKEKDITQFKDPVYLLNVTLHNGKTPDQYDYAQWDMPLTDNEKGNLEATLSTFDPTYLEFGQAMKQYKDAGIKVAFVNPIEGSVSERQFDRKLDGIAEIESIELPNGEKLYSSDLDDYFNNSTLPDLRPYLDTVAQVWADINTTYEEFDEQVKPVGFDAYLSIKNYLRNKIDNSPNGSIVINGQEVNTPYKASSLMFLQSGIDGFVYPAEFLSDNKEKNRSAGNFNYTVFDDNAPAIDNKMMMSIMANATNPNGSFEVISNQDEENGTTLTVYNYRNAFNQSSVSLEVTKDFVNNTGSISFITKNKNSQDTSDTIEAFVRMSKMLQMEGLTPMIDNYVNGYGYEFYNKLADQGLLIPNDLVNQINPDGSKNELNYYPIPPFAYNFSGEFAIENVGNGFEFGDSVKAMGTDMMYSISNKNADKQPAFTKEQFAIIDEIADSYRDVQEYVTPNFQQLQEQNKSWFGRVGAWFTEKLLPSSGLGEQYTRAKEKESGFIAKQNRAINAEVKKMTDILTSPEFTKLPQFKNLTPESLSDLVWLALSGDEKAYSLMPGDVQKMLNQCRNRISSLQEQLVRSGFLKPSTAAIIEASKGTYLTRGYLKYIAKHKEFAKNITEDKVNAALEGFYVWAKDGYVKEKQTAKGVVPLHTRWKRFDALNESIAKSNLQLNILNSKILKAESSKKSQDVLDELYKNKAILVSDIEKAKAKSIETFKSLDSDTKDMARTALNELMQPKEKRERDLFYGYHGSQIQLQTLKQRKDEEKLPKWLRDVLGEIKDPVLSYQLTTTNLTKMTGRIAYLSTIYDLAIKDGHAIRGVDLNSTQKNDLEKKGWRAINGLNGHTAQSAFGPFIGTYVSPTLYTQAFGDDLGISSIYMYRALLTIGKTAGNIFFGPIRNLMGNKGFLMLNGSFSKIVSNALGGTFKKENDYIKSLAKSKTTKGYREALNEYWKGVVDDAELLGVVTNVNSGAIKEMFKEFHNNPSLIKKLQDGDEEGFMNIYRNYLIPGWEKTRNFATESYMMADILPKVFAFNIQRNHLANRVYKMSYHELKTKAKNTKYVDAINEMAASYTNQTMVSEQRVAPAVANMVKEKPWYKQLPTFVFGGDFPRFKAEVFRIFITSIANVATKHDAYKNNIVLFEDEQKNSDMLKSLNNEERVHTVGGLALWSNAAAQMVGLYGATSAALLGLAGFGAGEDDDDELNAETDPQKTVQSPNTYGKLNENTGVWDKNSGMLSELSRLYLPQIDGGMSIDEALREFTPEFMQNHQIGFNLNGDGKVEYYDKGTVDPFSSVMALGRGFMYRPEQGFNNKLTGYMGSTFEEIFGEEMAVAAVIALIKNEDYRGRKIYDKTDDFLGKKSLDAIKYASLQLAPAAVGSVMRVYKNTQPVENYKGEVTKEPISLPQSLAKETMGAATGRTYNIDNPSGTLQNSLYSLNRSLETEMYEERKEKNAKRLLLQMNRKVEAMRTLGMPEEQILMSVGKTIRSNDVRLAVYYGGDYIDNFNVLSKEERKELYKQLK